MVEVFFDANATSDMEQSGISTFTLHNLSCLPFSESTRMPPWFFSDGKIETSVAVVQRKQRHYSSTYSSSGFYPAKRNLFSIRSKYMLMVLMLLYLNPPMYHALPTVAANLPCPCLSQHKGTPCRFCKSGRSRRVQEERIKRRCHVLRAQSSNLFVLTCHLQLAAYAGPDSLPTVLTSSFTFRTPLLLPVGPTVCAGQSEAEKRKTARDCVHPNFGALFPVVGRPVSRRYRHSRTSGSVGTHDEKQDAETLI